MSKSRFVFDKLSKLFEEGLINYKDLSNEILNILKSKRDDIVFRMKLTSKEETEVIIKRLEKLEKKFENIDKKRTTRKSKKARRS